MAAEIGWLSETTGESGQWKYGLMLDPGDYVLLFSKLGLVEPVVVNLTVS